MIVADTDVLIDYLRGEGEQVERIAFELQHGLRTTVVSAFELWAGAIGSAKRERAVDTLLAALTIVPLDGEDARAAAGVRRDLERAGRSIGMADSLIAGICVRHGAVLLTRNKDHFERIPNLRLSGRYE
ncbi:MAG: type II toxin-antitoxin system VapC family toxin [Deltaproteobacteria bacterium]|nr:type II toxin-antitoxin system VapC family toxin [Deltaproteobacteria bacterium]